VSFADFKEQLELRADREWMSDKMYSWAYATTPERSVVPVVGLDWSALSSRMGEQTRTKAMIVQLSVSELVTTGVTRPLTRSDQAVRERFDELFADWQARTTFVSALDDLIYDESFQRIIALGPQAIPLALEQLPTHPVPWFYALKILADADPASGVTDVDEAVQAWLEWGHANGYLAPE
jgi:hypothetical protein